MGFLKWPLLRFAAPWSNRSSRLDVWGYGLHPSRGVDVVTFTLSLLSLYCISVVELVVFEGCWILTVSFTGRKGLFFSSGI
jgi:hypothetical protein